MYIYFIKKSLVKIKDNTSMKLRTHRVLILKTHRVLTLKTHRVLILKTHRVLTLETHRVLTPIIRRIYISKTAGKQPGLQAEEPVLNLRITITDTDVSKHVFKQLLASGFCYFLLFLRNGFCCRFFLKHHIQPINF